MSKWGYKHQSNVLLDIKRRGGAVEIAAMVEEMAECILQLEEDSAIEKKSFYDLMEKLDQARVDLGLARSAEAHMRGYIERVKELDPNTSSEKKPDRVEVAMERSYGVNQEA